MTMCSCCISGNLTQTQDADNGLPINIVYLSCPCSEVMKSVDSHMWQLVTAVVMKVMV
jgi:hypothetical protein